MEVLFHLYEKYSIIENDPIKFLQSCYSDKC